MHRAPAPKNLKMCNRQRKLIHAMRVHDCGKVCEGGWKVVNILVKFFVCYMEVGERRRKKVQRLVETPITIEREAFKAFWEGI